MACEGKSNRDSQVRELFLEVCDIVDASEREQFLDQACGTDSTLKEEIESLLLSHLKSNTLMEKDFLGEFENSLGDLIGTHIGPYKILEKLGEGGFGEVFRVEQNEPIRRVLALKIIKPGMDSREISKRFESERQALALLDHPNIAYIVDAGATESGRPFFVMELVSGLPITKYCDKNGMSIDERLRLFQQVCRGVEHAHQKGIIHRDLNPSNIVVVEKEGIRIPKIIDFGISKSLLGHLTGETVLTRKQVFVGTPDYMSPEQLSLGSSDLDCRSDIYTLGCVLYELVAGSPPFASERMSQVGISEIHSVLMDEQPQKPSTHIRTLRDTGQFAVNRASTVAKVERRLRGDLDRVVLKCLEKDRIHRYDSVLEMEQDLNAFLNSRPVKATSPGLFYQGMKIIRRKRNSLAGWAVASILLVGFLALLGISISDNALDGQLDGYGKSIAVLPFDTQDQGAEREFFVKGIHEGVIVQIAGIPGIKVIAESSVRDYYKTNKSLQEIADELGVALLLRGGIRWVEDNFQLSVSLLDPTDNSHIWAESYNRKLSAENIFELQDKISREVADALEVVVAKRDEDQKEGFPTTNLKALEAYYLGRECLRIGSTILTRQAIAHFETAISLDESFALAHTSLGSGILRLSGLSGIPLGSVEDEIEACLERAHELDDSLGMTHLIEGSLRIRQKDYVAAEKAINTAIELDPNNPRVYISKAFLLQKIEGPEFFNEPKSELINLYEKALELDPNNHGAPYWRSRILLMKGQFAEALKIRRAEVSERPNDFGALRLLGSLLAHPKINQVAEAILHMRKAHALDPSNIEVLNALCKYYRKLGDADNTNFWMDRYISAQNRTLPRLKMVAVKAYLSGDDVVRLESALSGLKKSPRDNTFLWHAAEVDFVNGQNDQARRRWEKAYPELFTDNVDVPENLICQAKDVAVLLFRTGESEKASNLIGECLEVYDEESAFGFPLLGPVLHVLQGDEELALESLGKYVAEGGSPFYIRHQKEFDKIRHREEFQRLLAEADARMAVQLNRLREMEANGELSPIPELPVKKNSRVPDANIPTAAKEETGGV